MIEYYVAEHTKDENGSPQFVAKGSSISEREMNEMLDKFGFLGEIFQMQTLYNIAVHNAREYQSFMDQSNLRNLVFNIKSSPDAVVAEANRLLFNFCITAQSFINYAEKASKKSGNENKKHFNEYISNLFDNCFEYRFFYKLRNFCAHYSFPISQITTSEPSVVQVTCSKEHLLSYDGWGRIVQNDLAGMDSTIDILDYVEPYLNALTDIMYLIYYYYTPYYMEALKTILHLQNDYHTSLPVFISFKDRQPLEAKPIPVKRIFDDLPLLGKNPYQDIVIEEEDNSIKLSVVPV